MRNGPLISIGAICVAGLGLLVCFVRMQRTNQPLVVVPNRGDASAYAPSEPPPADLSIQTPPRSASAQELVATNHATVFTILTNAESGNVATIFTNGIITLRDRDGQSIWQTNAAGLMGKAGIRSAHLSRGNIWLVLTGKPANGDWGSARIVISQATGALAIGMD